MGFWSEVKKFVATVLAIIAIVLVILCIFVYFGIFAVAFAEGGALGFLAAWGLVEWYTFLILALLVGALGCAIDGEAAAHVFATAGEAVGDAAEAIIGFAGDILAGAAAGAAGAILSSPLLLLAGLGIGAYFIFKDDEPSGQPVYPSITVVPDNPEPVSS
jgi:hypothetical protein